MSSSVRALCGGVRARDLRKIFERRFRSSLGAGALSVRAPRAGGSVAGVHKSTSARRADRSLEHAIDHRDRRGRHPIAGRSGASLVAARTSGSVPSLQWGLDRRQSSFVDDCQNDDLQRPRALRRGSRAGSPKNLRTEVSVEPRRRGLVGAHTSRRWVGGGRPRPPARAVQIVRSSTRSIIETAGGVIRSGRAVHVRRWSPPEHPAAFHALQWGLDLSQSSFVDECQNDDLQRPPTLRRGSRAGSPKNLRTEVSLEPRRRGLVGARTSRRWVGGGRPRPPARAVQIVRSSTRSRGSRMKQRCDFRARPPLRTRRGPDA
jgi:hypothetical protein